jgi:hypothetical protein
MFLFLSATPMRAVSGRSRPMRARFPTVTRRCRLTEEAHSLIGRRECGYHERHCFRKNSDIFVKTSFELRLLYIVKHGT